jgi:hypothetical protein
VRCAQRCGPSEEQLREGPLKLYVKVELVTGVWPVRVEVKVLTCVDSSVCYSAILLLYCTA